MPYIRNLIKRLLRRQHSIPHIRYGKHIGFVDSLGVWIIQCRKCGRWFYIMPFGQTGVGKREVFESAPSCLDWNP